MCIDKSLIHILLLFHIVIWETAVVVTAIVVGDDVKQTCVGWQYDFQRNVKNRFLPVCVCVVKTIDNNMYRLLQWTHIIIILWRTKSFLIVGDVTLTYRQCWLCFSRYSSTFMYYLLLKNRHIVPWKDIIFIWPNLLVSKHEVTTTLKSTITLLCCCI